MALVERSRISEHGRPLAEGKKIQEGKRATFIRMKGNNFWKERYATGHRGGLSNSTFGTTASRDGKLTKKGWVKKKEESETQTVTKKCSPMRT